MYMRDYMNPDVITVTSGAPIEEAERIMKAAGVRRLPVVDKGKLVGLVTRRTLATARPSVATTLSIWESNYLLARVKVRDVMERHVFTLTPDEPIDSAIIEAQKRGIGTLVVVDKDEPTKVVGIATATDLYETTLQILGIGQPNARLRVLEPSRIGSTNHVVTIIGKHGAKIKSLVSVLAPRVASEDAIVRQEDCLIHLDTIDAGSLVDELTDHGYKVEVVAPWYSPDAPQ